MKITAKDRITTLVYRHGSLFQQMKELYLDWEALDVEGSMLPFDDNGVAGDMAQAIICMQEARLHFHNAGFLPVKPEL